MKTLKTFGFVLLASAFMLPIFAQHSTITDKEAGLAANIVETNNVIHVYDFLGLSPEASWPSTFDEGEDWRNYVWTPKKTNVTTKLNVNTNINGLQTSNFKTPYVQAIDDCLAAGDTWDHRTDTCN